MEDEKITFKTAKLAKEKGFNIDVLNCYYKDKTFVSGRLYNNSYLANYNINKDKFSAPIQSLLQRWLREKHNLDICPDIGVHSQSNKKVYYYYIWDIFDLNKRMRSKKTQVYNTFEEALEMGLQESLKLIE